jgi:hypothetical protein
MNRPRDGNGAPIADRTPGRLGAGGMSRYRHRDQSAEPDGRPAPDFRAWLRANGLLDGDFGIPAEQYAREPTATAYVGKRFNRVAGVWEPESLAGDAEPG